MPRASSRRLITRRSARGFIDAASVNAPLGSGGPVNESLSREIDGGLKTNARWFPQPAQLEMICHPIQDVLVSKPDTNIWKCQDCKFGDRSVGVRPDFRLALPIRDQGRFG